jgi:hypothetical protein
MGLRRLLLLIPGYRYKRMKVATEDKRAKRRLNTTFSMDISLIPNMKGNTKGKIANGMINASAAANTIKET